MDARSLAAAAGINIGTLNVWVQRGLVPGMKIGARGRQRDFDQETATGVLLLAELVQFGLSAPLASVIAGDVRNRHVKRLLITRPQNPDRGEVYRTAYYDSDDHAIIGMNGIRALAEQRGEPRPIIFVMVDVEALEEKMRAIHTEWERQRESEAA